MVGWLNALFGKKEESLARVYTHQEVMESLVGKVLQWQGDGSNNGIINRGLHYVPVILLRDQDNRLCVYERHSGGVSLYHSGEKHPSMERDEWGTYDFVSTPKGASCGEVEKDKLEGSPFHKYSVITPEYETLDKFLSEKGYDARTFIDKCLEMNPGKKGNIHFLTPKFSYKLDDFFNAPTHF